MEHSVKTEIELDHGTNWYTVYEAEIFGEINPGSRGDRITPGEDPFLDGPIRIEVREVVDYRFGDTGCPLNLIEGGFSEKFVGEWLKKQLSEKEIADLEEKLLDGWREYMADRAADEAEARAEAQAAQYAER